MVTKIKTLNRGFTPAAGLPPNTIPLKEGYTSIIGQRRCGQGGRVMSPPSFFLCF